jgi:hypothetical protein
LGLLDEIKMTVRYSRGLPSFVRHPLGPDDCRQFILGQLAVRTQNFLRMLERGVFDNPKSPYRPLFDWAGIGLAEVAEWTADLGVEGALSRLCDSGVSLSLAEFKGRQAIERDGKTLNVRSEDFDNPLVQPQFEGRTGGSRGPGRRLLLDLDLLTHDAACHYLFLEGFDLLNRRMGVWRSVPPDNSGIKKLLAQGRLGMPVSRWFTHAPLRASGGQWKYFVFTWQTLAGFRFLGTPQAPPEYTPFSRADKVAQWLAEERHAGCPAHLDTLAGSAVRVCLAAKANGLDISGTLFRVGGEPLTPGKAQIVTAAGCRVVCHYSMSELGHVGMACANGKAIDDVHLMKSKVAIIQRPGGSLLVTALAPSSPKLMLNVETGDTGVLEERSCGCPFEAIGFHQHLHGIRSHEKLTSEGTNFLGTELLTLIDEVLPKAFGGGPTDYQLVQEEREGLSRVRLVISPRLGPLDRGTVIATAVRFLGTRSLGNQLMTDFWVKGDTLQVDRCEPYATSAGKVHALHILS